MRTSKLVSLGMFVLILAACDEHSPIAPPEPVANVAGSWAGTVSSLTEAGNFCSEPASASLSQSGETLSGTLADTADCFGRSEYQLEAYLTGSTFRGSATAQGISFDVSGAASEKYLEISWWGVKWMLER
jgi:hypothetical protein